METSLAAEWGIKDSVGCYSESVLGKFLVNISLERRECVKRRADRKGIFSSPTVQDQKRRVLSSKSKGEKSQGIEKNTMGFL